MTTELIISMGIFICFIALIFLSIVAYAIYRKNHLNVEQDSLTEKEEKLYIDFVEKITKEIIEISKKEKISEYKAKEKVLMSLSPQEVLRFNKGESIIYNKNEIEAKGKEYIEECLKQFLISSNNSNVFYIRYRGLGFVKFDFSDSLDPSIFNDYTKIAELDGKYTIKYVLMYIDLIDEVIKEAGLKCSDLEIVSRELAFQKVYL